MGAFSNNNAGEMKCAIDFVENCIHNGAGLVMTSNIFVTQGDFCLWNRTVLIRLNASPVQVAAAALAALAAAAFQMFLRVPMANAWFYTIK